MFSLATLVIVLTSHCVSDFVLQTQWMATNKSSSLNALTVHVFQYTVSMLALVGLGTIIWTLILGASWLNIAWIPLVIWCGLNGLAHWVVDFCSSRLNKRWLAANQLNRFWITIGFDQLAHYICLFSSLVVVANL